MIIANKETKCHRDAAVTAGGCTQLASSGLVRNPPSIWLQTRLSHRHFTTITPNPSQSKKQDHFRKPQGVHILETYQDPSCPKEGQEGMARENKHTNKGFQE